MGKIVGKTSLRDIVNLICTGATLTFVNSKLQVPVFLSETSGTGQSVNIDSAQYRYLLVGVVDGAYATHAILSPNAISSLTAVGIQSQIGLQTAAGYAYVNFLLAGGVFTWSSDSSKTVDIYGIK